VATTQSFLSVLSHPTEGAIYLDVAAGVTAFLLAGRYFEAVSRRRTGDALRALAALGARDASVLDSDGTERRVPVESLRIGQRFVVRPGETVATDGTVIAGQAAVDRSMVTGESYPVEVDHGDRVVGGTVSLTGRLVVEATEVGASTQLAHMLALVEQAQHEKAAVQRLADRAAGVFVPAVLVLAALTFVGWLVASGSPEKAFSTALAVLIIACPCALGLATPTALYVASSRGAQLGLFVKGYQALETSKSVDTVIFDKTGTVTDGRMSVADVAVAPHMSEAEVLRLAGALEAASQHPVAAAVLSAARAVNEVLPAVTEFSSSAGRGVQGTVEEHAVVVGTARLIAERGAEPDPALGDLAERWEHEGRTVVLVAVDRKVVGAVAVADAVKPSAAAALDRLHALGLRCVLLSGDNPETTAVVGTAIGADEVHAAMLPEDKVAFVRTAQAAGHSVAMVGDGINDGPVLVAAELGIAIGSGTDVALNAADMILVRDDLTAVPQAIGLARTTLHTIRMNLVWAFAYNLAAIPLAAVGLLNPLVAAASMALSSTFVVWNSARIRHCGAPARTGSRRRGAPRPARSGA
jgi:cation-transporting P-type ATPase A/B/Cu+-exporting ATPase